MNYLTIDFETYYSQTFSLKKLTTEEYIRSQEFEVIGVAVGNDHQAPVWFSGTKAQTKNFLNQFDWGSSIAVAHNAMFDMAILNWHFDIRPKRIMDTLSIARGLLGPDASVSLASLAERFGLGVKGNEVINALGKRRVDFGPEELARYGEYCCNDVSLTHDLLKKILPGYPLNELKLIDLTIRMFTEPALELDDEVLYGHLLEVRDMKARVLHTVEQSATKGDLMSNPKFAALLEGRGVTPPTKISPITGKETFAFGKTDEEFKALLEHPDHVVQALVSARLGTKSTIEETRTERFRSIATRGKLPIPLRYYAAHTGRWGGDDKVNLQNLPRASELKRAMVAPPGYRVIDSDSSQIEARTLAWLAGQDDLVASFAAGEDVYKIMASKIYNKPEKDIGKDQRFVGKTTILGAGYGMGHIKFAKQLKTFGVEISEDEAQSIITTYRTSYPRIPQLWKDAGRILEAIIENQFAELGRDGVLKVEGRKGIRLPNGMYLKYPNLRRVINEEDGKAEIVYDTKRGRATIPNRIYGGKVVENVCQALARIIIGEQMLMIAKKYRVVMTVHDAICCVVPENEVDTAQEFVELCMKLRPEWALELPLNCEAGSGRSYRDC